MSITSELTALADAIRSKSGTSGKLTIPGMTDVVDGIEIGGGGGIDFFECASYTPDADAYTQYSFILTNAPEEKANGTYIRTMWLDDATVQEQNETVSGYFVASTWRNENGYVLREDVNDVECIYSIEDANGNIFYWNDNLLTERYDDFNRFTWRTYYTGDFVGLTFSDWQTQEMPPTLESWSGYKVEQNNDTGVWTTTDTLVGNMQVLYQKPKVGEIYSADTSILIKKMFDGSVYPIPSDGLVFYAPLDSDYVDMVSGQSAVVEGGSFTTHNGLNCLYLNGSEYVKWGENNQIPVGNSVAISLVALIAPTSQNGWRSYMEVGTENKTWMSITANYGDIHGWGGSSITADGKWQSVVISKAADATAKAYLNGQQATGGAYNTTALADSCVFAGSTSQSNTMIGYIAFAAVYNRELSADEVLEIHNTLMQGVLQ